MAFPHDSIDDPFSGKPKAPAGRLPSRTWLNHWTASRGTLLADAFGLPLNGLLVALL
jgi:hypothetical protein